MTQAGLNLPQSFRAMIILTLLPDDFFTLSSTIIQTVEETNFTVDTIISWVLHKINLHSSCKPLSSWIANVEFKKPSASTNRTNVIWHSPPTNNQWRNQNNSHQRLSEQQNFNSAYQSSGNSYQKKRGPAKSNWPGKKQKKDWFKQCQNDKGKKKAQAHEVTFANTIIGEEDTINPSECFMDHIEDVDMEDNFSNIAHARWDEDTGMNIAGPLSMPFQPCSSRKCSFWGDYHWAEEEEKTEDFFLTWWYGFGQRTFWKFGAVWQCWQDPSCFTIRSSHGSTMRTCIPSTRLWPADLRRTWQCTCLLVSQCFCTRRGF